MMMPISGRLLDRFGPKLVVIPGLLLLAFATWLLSDLDLGTSGQHDPLRPARCAASAMGLMFMPVMTVSMDTIPPHLISRASALSNVLRQLFGAFSTGIFATILLQREQFHQAMLSQNVTSTNVAAVSVLLGDPDGDAASAACRGGGPGSRHLAALMKQVSVAATVRSFDDCFLLATCISMCGVLPALFLKRGKKAAHHDEAVILE